MVTLGDGARRGLLRSLWVAAALMVGLSALSWIAARLTVGTSVGWVMDEVHQNLSVAVDLALPTWLSSMLWALFGLLALIQALTDHARRGWWFLTAIATVASVDEFLMLHERLSRPATHIERALAIDLGGATWALLGVLAAAAVAAVLWRFVMSWPRQARRAVLLGGGMFLIGSLGFEVVHNLLELNLGLGAPVAVLAYHIEEALEKAGLIVAIGGLSSFLPVTIVEDTAPGMASAATGGTAQ